MDYWTRIIFSGLIGLGAGLTVAHFFGNVLFWVLICMAIALATETTLRTIKNVGAPPSPLGNRPPEDLKIRIRKPPKPKF